MTVFRFIICCFKSKRQNTVCIQVNLFLFYSFGYRHRDSEEESFEKFTIWIIQNEIMFFFCIFFIKAPLLEVCSLTHKLPYTLIHIYVFIFTVTNTFHFSFSVLLYRIALNWLSILLCVVFRIPIFFLIFSTVFVCV